MTRVHNYFVYILECSDGFYYTGVTNNIDRRLREYNEGINPTSFTHKRRPIVLRYCKKFKYILDAIAWEKQLKGWSRKKKEALFIEDWCKIVELARNADKRRQSSTGSD